MPTIESIILAFADEFDLTPSRILGRIRTRHTAEIRHLVTLAIRDHTSWSLVEIGHAMGRRDHGTVIHSIRRASQLLRTRPDLARRYRAACHAARTRSHELHTA